ncbi:hypothetical protein [Roseibium polysiphoniae]|uniref:hypothetical protein n=1 Tax=Roseibium polysiphoniae TaxID=2571221 RepID=UPI00329811A3
MTIKSIAAGLCLFALAASGSARADDVDFARFMKYPAGASGIAAAIGGLGNCDTPLWWGYAYDEAKGAENKDHLFFACQFYDRVEEDMFDKSVVAKFVFWDDKLVQLESLTYLP